MELQKNRGMCTRNALWALVLGTALVSVALVYVDSGEYLSISVGDEVAFAGTVFIPLLAVAAMYSYRFYIGADFEGIPCKRSSSDMLSMGLFTAGFLLPPLWPLNATIHLRSDYKRTKFWAAFSLLTTIILLAVLPALLVP
eukprot:TRINITY_DN3932_c0_g1_i1.p1 TRINITY_DN3932_c0_g1~~TRINITY_DN3932_c0_g1_i1.p1  ORF type:complete len:141 (+),score=11.18 TRINITY_DN3932_c0_g1_i1:259-681(+)